jgi:hypothetical protein
MPSLRLLKCRACAALRLLSLSTSVENERVDGAGPIAVYWEPHPMCKLAKHRETGQVKRPGRLSPCRLPPLFECSGLPQKEAAITAARRIEETRPQMLRGRCGNHFWERSVSGSEGDEGGSGLIFATEMRWG